MCYKRAAPKEASVFTKLPARSGSAEQGDSFDGVVSPGDVKAMIKRFLGSDEQPAKVRFVSSVRFDRPGLTAQYCALTEAAQKSTLSKEPYVTIDNWKLPAGHYTFPIYSMSQSGKKNVCSSYKALIAERPLPAYLENLVDLSFSGQTAGHAVHYAARVHARQKLLTCWEDPVCSIAVSEHAQTDTDPYSPIALVIYRPIKHANEDGYPVDVQHASANDVETARSVLSEYLKHTETCVDKAQQGNAGLSRPAEACE
jgi:hypothetical protein